MVDALSPFQVKLLTSVDSLGIGDRDRVLAFAEALKESKPKVKGISGVELLKVVDSLDFSKEDGQEMERAIEDGCERIDPDGW